MNRLKKIFFIGILSLISFFAYSQDFPQKPYPPKIVNDFAGLLSPQEQQALENKLVQFSNETSTQIAIVVVKSLDGYDPSQYAFELGDKWGIGQKGKNNGILILVKPKYNSEKGEVFIATGYGLEGAVPDALAKRIVNNDILPFFRQDQYYHGLDSAVNTIMGLTKGEFTADQYTKKTQGAEPYSIVIIILIVIVVSIISRFRQARHYSIGHNLPFWIALGMLSNQSKSSGGGFGSFTSGSGGFGGGGFGGFGGGSFGGGGAGGSW
ncbi:MAG: YgcG family protein [Bacteroidales bacterium]